MYLFRSKFGVYYYRYTLPRYIREQHPSTPPSIKRTLKTSQRNEAVYLVSKWHMLVHEAITKLLKDGTFSLPYSLNTQHISDKRRHTEITKLEDNYFEEKVRCGSWTFKTYKQYKAQFILFRRIVGKFYIEDITHKDIALYKQTLYKLPTNMTKYPELQSCTMSRALQIIKMQNMKLLSATTIRNNCQNMKAFFLWCYKAKYITEPIHEGLLIPRNKNPLKRKPFNESDLQKLFAYVKTNSWRNCEKPYQYWLPLLAYYTGARLNELCQLHITDVVTVDDVLCISINDKNGKRLKNDTAKRIIPLHDELIKLGFKQYVEMLKVMQRANIFEELNTGNKEYCFGRVAGSWFAAYKKEVCVNTKEKVFHSFRHTFANTLKQNGVEEALAAALLGHAHNSMSYGNYGSEYGVDKLYESLKCLNSV
jgi:integrase